MTDTASHERRLFDRTKLAKVIRRRPRVGPVTALLLSLAFALLLTPVVMLDTLLIESGAVAFEAGERAPITLRIRQFAGFSDGSFALSGPIVLARGELIDAGAADIAHAILDRYPSGQAAFAAYFAGLFLLILVYTTQLRRSHRGRLLRTQVINLLFLAAGLLAFKLALMLSSISVLIVPVAGVALVVTLVVDVSAGLATGILASVLTGLLVPFDVGVIAVLGIQAASGALFLGDRRHKNRRVLAAGLLCGAVAAIAYVVCYYLATLSSPAGELSEPTRSALVAACLGGVLSGILAIPTKPAYQYLLGDITKNKLVELEDLSHPLLKQIAENSPGTWQHSLAMANMAEIAANAIGANGRLVRVGAYYHDLGKSLQPKYFIENLQAGESSPHDRLLPEISCDAIFAHVTEGIRVARTARLPERIIDFMHMHHGDGLLEYFWAKCRESGNPNKLSEEHFRYPGVPPQSRETAILAICDAVEAASRTLKNPDEKAISNLVQRIVYGKLHLGQLDESGLSMADLRKISDSLRETIKHAHHGRIEYPWQREERSIRQDGEAQAAVAPAPLPVSATQRIIAEPRLDSLDAPRPYWRDMRASSQSASRLEMETAPTEDLGRPAAPAAPVVPSSAAQDPAPAAPPLAPGATWMPAADLSPALSPTLPLPVIESAADAASAAAPSPSGPDAAPLPAEAEPAPAAQDPAAPAAPVAAETSGRRRPPPPPESPQRHSRSTIELMKEPEARESAPAENTTPVDEDGDEPDLAPGIVVMGPPPATRRKSTEAGDSEPPASRVTIMPRKKP